MAETLTITSGLPFGKELNVTLPTGRTWWTNVSDFEVLMQVREEKNRNSTLVKDFAQYLTVTMPSADVVKIEVFLTGAETRTLDRGGYYDVLISDLGITDERAYVVLAGAVKRLTVITAETEGAV